MSNINLNTRVKHKTDTQANWESNNPVLLNGEIAIVKLTSGGINIKVGDGTSTYSQLPFIISETDISIYVQNDQPTTSSDGDLWVDLDETASGATYLTESDIRDIINDVIEDVLGRTY